jgi:quercetin dioxygenase-like cupin family protein
MSNSSEEEERTFVIAQFQQPTDDDVPIRSLITQSNESAVVAWHVKPGQRILPHIHPNGQDTWTILSGQGMYQIDAEGTTIAIGVGFVVVARKGQVHGVYNHGTEPLEFLSVVAPAGAGYEPVV